MEFLEFAAVVTRYLRGEPHRPKLRQCPELSNKEARVVEVYKLVRFASFPELAEKSVHDAVPGHHAVATRVVDGGIIGAEAAVSV